jgi:hypothetical protein
MTETPLRCGDEVEVRSAAEILATLDENACVDGLPFMPEMLGHCGRRYRVAATGERICDTIHYRGSMRLPDAVILEDLRCDGAGHAGCQAECLVFWKACWLRRVQPGAAAIPAAPAADARAAEERIAASCRNDQWVDGQQVERYRCQATELVRASQPIGLTDMKSYIRVLQSGSVAPGRFARVMGRALVQESLYKLGRIPDIHLAGDGSPPPVEPPLDLKPGEWVEVRSVEEIRRTLSPKGKNRGLWFDREMMVFCGRRFRVRRRVTRIVDETNGRLVTIKGDCIMLEGVYCSGERSLKRWLCPRAIYSYWRESWLKRVPSGPSGQAT